MEKLVTKDRSTKGNSHSTTYLIFSKFQTITLTCILDGLKISNSQVKRLTRELKQLKEEVCS